MVLSKKVFCLRPTDFTLLGVIFTLLNFFRFQTNLKIYSGKPDISFKFNSDKNIVKKTEILKQRNRTSNRLQRH